MLSALNSADELGAMSVKQFGARYHLGHTKIYEEIGAGRLRAVKCGSRTLILAQDAKIWERSLPVLSNG